MSSMVKGECTLDEGFELWLFAISNYRFFVGNFLNKLIDISSISHTIYSGDRLSRSIDFV